MKLSVQKQFKFGQYVKVQYPRKKPFFGWVYDQTIGPGSLGPVESRVYVREKDGAGTSHLARYVSEAREKISVRKKWQGLSPHRYRDNSLEKAFAVAWQNFNGKTRTLDYLLSPGCEFPRPAEASEIERVTANTVIQWLGSPVGQGFLTNVLLTTVAGREFLKRLREP